MARSYATTTAVLIVTMMMASSAAHAEKRFSDSSLSLLHSDDYQTFGDRTRSDTYVTFENVTAHDWGGTFLFVDRNQGHGWVEDDLGAKDDDIYGELSPVLSLGWLTGRDLGTGPIRDVSLAATYEFGGGANANNLLSGISLAWDVPGLQYVNSAFYYVNNDTDTEYADDWQVTLAWGAPFEVGASRLLFDGYIDYSSAASDHAAEFHFNPQLKLDLGHYGGSPGVLYAGIEYSYWENKYGAPDSLMDTERAVSALVKFHF